MNAGKVWCGISLLAVLCSFVVPARAESEAQKKQAAKEHYEIATRFYDLGKYGEAIQEYEAAYLLVADPNLLYNIGQAYRLWDKPEEAIRSYKNYLRHRPEAPNRPDVEKRIAELERASEEHRPSVPEPPAPTPGATPTSEPPPVAPPLASSAPGPVPPVAAAVAQTTPPKPAGPSWLDRNSRIGAYVMFSAGGACLLTSMVTGVLASKKAKQLADDSKQPNHPVYDPSLQSSGKTLNTVAVITGVTGLALGGAGLYLFFRSRRVSEEPSAEPAKPLTLYPLAGPGLAGVGANLAF